MLSIIVATSRNGVIGKEGKMPWRLATDLRIFKERTTGHKVIMGRKTFDSILARLGKPLPDREHFVFTRDHNFHRPDVHVMESGDLEDLVSARQEAFVVGGGEIYKFTMPYVRRVYLTRVDTVLDGDAFFPDGPYLGWSVVQKTRYPKSKGDEYPFDVVVYERF